jgi:hypothetical protein
MRRLRRRLQLLLFVGSLPALLGRIAFRLYRQTQVIMAGLDNIDPANACCLAVPPARPAWVGPRILPGGFPALLGNAGRASGSREFQWSENTPYSGEPELPARFVC